MESKRELEKEKGTKREIQGELQLGSRKEKNKGNLMKVGAERKTAEKEILTARILEERS